MTATDPCEPRRPQVIVVDDDPAVTHALEFAFGLEGFDVRSHRDAESLLRDGVGPGVGCLVLDYALPGMNGLELLERLRAAGVGLPAILITTNPRAALRQRAAAAGAPIVEKPLLSDALLEAVRSAVGRAPLSAG